MSEPQPVITLPPWLDNVARKDTTVNIDNIDNELALALAQLARIHRALFVTALTVTSGNDGPHVPGSLHFKGRAVDIRMKDKTPTQHAAFMACVHYTAGVFRLGYFYELNPTGLWHLHLELPR